MLVCFYFVALAVSFLVGSALRTAPHCLAFTEVSAGIVKAASSNLDFSMKNKNLYDANRSSIACCIISQQQATAHTQLTTVPVCSPKPMECPERHSMAEFPSELSAHDMPFRAFYGRKALKGIPWEESCTI